MCTLSSAALSEAERKIQHLEKENSHLQNELLETKSLYSQLVLESERESFDERRVLLLKSQIIQLERQLLLMSNAMGARVNVQLEIEISMLDIADRCRKYICIDNKSPDVSVPRVELMRQVELAESVRLKLSKNIENSSTENLAKPLLLMDRFVKPGPADSECTLFDVCSGKLDHLNLKHIGKLENELSTLYCQLVSLEKSIGKTLVKRQNHDTRVHMPAAELERQYLSTQKAVDQIQLCCEQLLSLSILVPAAPLPAFKSKIKGVTTEKVLSSLPTTVKTKQDTKQVIEALMKSMNYSIHMKSVEIDALKDELKFHQNIYNIQCQYMDDLFQAMRLGYSKFEDNAVECLVNPLEEVFEKYEVLRTDASEEALRNFLTTFKSRADDIQTAITKMKPEDDPSEALSAFGEEFFSELSVLQNNCAKKRDQFVSDLEIVKDQRAQHLEQLEVLLDPKEPKQSVAKLEYDRVIGLNDRDLDSDDRIAKPRVNKKKTSQTRKTEMLTNECGGCVNDLPPLHANCTESSKSKDSPTSDESGRSIPEPKIPRTPIYGSSIPRTPSSSSRRTSLESRSKPSSANSNTNANTALPVRSRSLKLKR